MESVGFLGGGGSLLALPPLPFHICSSTSSAPSWERTECLSNGVGGGVSAVPGGEAMGLAGSQDPGPPFLLLHAAWEQGLLTPWEPINRKQTPTWHMLLQLGPLITVPPALPLPRPTISESKTKDLKCMNNIKLRGTLLGGGRGNENPS